MLKLNYLRNERGLTLIQILFIVVIMLGLTVVSATYIVNGNKTRAESEITANISTLESAVKTYYTSKNAYPVKANVNLSTYKAHTHQKKFFDALVATSNLPQATVDVRVKLVDTDILKQENIITTAIKNPEDYLLDTKTGKVYNVRQNATAEDIEKTVKQLLSDAGDVVNLNKIAEFKLEKDGKQIQEVYATVSHGNKIVVGGLGTMSVAVMSLTVNGDKTTAEITDLTPKLTAPPDGGVTELRLVGEGKVLVHYFGAGKLQYDTLDF